MMPRSKPPCRTPMPGSSNREAGVQIGRVTDSQRTASTHRCPQVRPMAAGAFRCVDDYRSPMVVTAGAHPLNAVPVGGALVVLLLTGFFLAASTLLFFDVLVLLAVLRSSQLRHQLSRRADRRA